MKLTSSSESNHHPHSLSFISRRVVLFLYLVEIIGEFVTELHYLGVHVVLDVAQETSPLLNVLIGQRKVVQDQELFDVCYQGYERLSCSNLVKQIIVTQQTFDYKYQVGIQRQIRTNMALGVTCNLQNNHGQFMQLY